MRREYGCGVRDLVDAPLSAATLTAFYAAAAEALDKYEPRLRVSRVYGQLDDDNNLILTVEGIINMTAKKLSWRALNYEQHD